jgi:hypothetical protein
MTSKTKTAPPATAAPDGPGKLRRQYGCGPVEFTGTDDARAQQQLGELLADPEGRARMALLNVASSGKLSSDRTIAEYAAEVWGAEPCPVP